MKIILLSDTHGRHHRITVPEGDMVIHAGDFSARGRKNEIEDFLNWFAGLPHRYKVFIAGNHDFLAENHPKEFLSLIPEGLIYLNDSEVEIEGISIWGSPVQPWFYDWAFNRKRGSEIKQHWDLIPAYTQILVTHGPPFGVLDEVVGRKENVGCEELMKKVEKVRPMYHVFGHIHEAYGQKEQNGTIFINASNLNEHYEPVNAPVVIEI